MLGGRFADLSLEWEVRFQESRDRGRGDSFDNVLLRAGKAKRAVLFGPFGCHIGETGNARTIGKPAVDSCLDEVRSQERER